MEISQLLNTPESKTLEFKKDLSSLAPIVKTIVAFANTAGGILIIGCSNEGKVTGIADILKAEEMLANAIADSIAPSILPEIEIATVEDKHLLIVKVAYWKAPFYIKKEGVPRGVYIRLGSTSRPAGPELVAELQRSVINLSYDQQPIPDLSLAALDATKIKTAFSTIRKKVDDKKLRSLGICVPFQGKLVPSIGGLILFGKTPIRHQYFPDARVRCARFYGKDKTHIIDQHEVEGTILDAVEEVPKFIARNTRLAAQIQEMRRQDIPEYSPIALREVLINALAHADYSIVGATIQIAIFEDRLEIHNPGMLPFGFTMDDLKAGVSRARNRVIAKVFHELKLMEEWGSGYKRVLTACRKSGDPDPEWLEQGTSMRVTFFSHTKAAHKKPMVPSTEPLSEREQAILSLFKGGQPLSFRNIFGHLKPKISERTLRYELAQLRKKGVIAPQGKGPATLWQYKK